MRVLLTNDLHVLRPSLIQNALSLALDPVEALVLQLIDERLSFFDIQEIVWLLRVLMV